MGLFVEIESEQTPKKPLKADLSAKLGEVYTVRLNSICVSLGVTKTDFLKKKIDETWYKLECFGLFKD